MGCPNYLFLRKGYIDMKDTKNNNLILKYSARNVGLI
jgi:hypothetical protein